MAQQPVTSASAIDRSVAATSAGFRRRPGLMWIAYLLTGFYCLSSILALLWTVYTSLKSDGDLFGRGRGSAAVAVRGQVDRDAADGTIEALRDRLPGATIERQAVQEHQRRARTAIVVAEAGRRVRRHRNPPGAELFETRLP